MLGFWIVISHLVGAYIIPSDYVLKRGANSTTFAILAAFLYMIPFILFLPGSIPSFIGVLLFRFLVIRFSLIDYVVWAKNLLAPAGERGHRVVREGVLDWDTIPTSSAFALHGASLALHSVFMGICLIVL